MSAPEFGHQTERRRRYVTRLVAAGLAAVILVIVAYRLKSQRPEKRGIIPAALPANVDQQLSGYSFTRSDNGKQVFTVHASRTVAFKEGGETVLKDVWVEVYGRTGNRDDLIRTQACDFNRKTGELYADGKVEIELDAPAGDIANERANLTHHSAPTAAAPAPTRSEPNPIYLETSRLSFMQQGSLVVTDAPVSFHTGGTSGSAEGLTYATRDDWLEFRKNVVIEMPSRPAGRFSAPLRLTASALRYEKAAGMVSLAGPVEITELRRSVHAAGGRVYLNAQNRATAAVLEGGVEVRGPYGGSNWIGSTQSLRSEFDRNTEQLVSMSASGGVQAESDNGSKMMRLAAQTFQLSFAGRPAKPLDGSAEGRVHLTVDSNSADASPSLSPSPASVAAAKQELIADSVNFKFVPDGATLQTASTVGQGKMVLSPNSPKVGERVITADPFVMTFDAAGRPATLAGLSQARITFMPPAGAKPGTPDATTSSDRFLATFDPSGRSLRSVDQAGSFRFEQGDQQGASDRARYDAQAETVMMTGHPRLSDPQTVARADRILIDTSSSAAEGIGHVQATRTEKPGEAAGGPAAAPLHIVADKVFADRDSGYVHYEGHVRIWRGQDVVESQAMDVLKAERRVRTDSRVLTSFLQSAAEAAGGAARPHTAKDQDAPVTIRADSLDYSEDHREATYRGNVQLETENATLHSDRMKVYFSASDNKGASAVERVVADGHVMVLQPGRRATGTRAEYFAGPGKILLTGGPPALYDAQKGFTTGRQLTFFLRDDTIFLDGGDKSPTLSQHPIPQ